MMLRSPPGLSSTSGAALWLCAKCLRRFVPHNSELAVGTLSTQRAFSTEPPALEDFPEERVRNFSIVAHVDHGKSTLADRLLETTGVIKEGRQVLDHLPVERERGITVKAQSASMVHLHRGHRYLLNLIDTPGHVDFSYEVSRSLAASQGVVLLVDAQQGVQAQTVANFLLSFEANLSIIPVINKIDLPLANIERVNEQLHNVFGFSPEEGIQISAKHGTGIDKVLSAIIEKIPRPSGSRDKPLCVLLLTAGESCEIHTVTCVGGINDAGVGVCVCRYDHYRGVVCVVAVKDGSIGVGDEVSSYHTGLSYEVAEVGLLQTKRVPIPRLYSGQVGYVLLGMRNSTEAHVGDTFYHTGSKVTPLPGFIAAKPMEFDASILVTTPSVPYKGWSSTRINDRRGVQQELVYMDQSKVLLKYTLPLSEVVIDFNDQVKSLSSGYASFDYEEHGYEPAPLVKVSYSTVSQPNTGVMLNGRVVDALASVVHRTSLLNWQDHLWETQRPTSTECRHFSMIESKHSILLYRQLLNVAIQAAIGKRIMSRETPTQVSQTWCTESTPTNKPAPRAAAAATGQSTLELYRA
ncbi:Translation factor Guf1, mitochondrial [Geodia barretti]|uniref:Translation factor Guf1, mitochondrial n=1 Tax=Geodia barretti TaxID=519541 RepID=A0AA35RX41_GEOBA|nr:Translation factor Guf1, mitochondrial [Geodia barretti]